LPSETMIWQPEFTDKILSRKPGAVQYIKNTYLPPVTLRIPVNSLRYGYLPCFAGNKEATLSQPLIITMQPDKVKNSLPEYYRRDGRC
ncbi:hypothetical protein, partial [Escherichia coli]|uniref:hypothetical protein n=1 Tax=Escherichia coli TaxID=562 RepID=UPI003A98245D